MELHEALSQIGEIRTSLAQSEVVVPTRSVSVCAIGGLAGVGGLIQAVWIPQPTNDLHAYLVLWISTAAVSLAVVAAEVAMRYLRASTGTMRRATLQAIEQFVPCLLAGSSITWAIVRYAPEAAALLPGLWAITFGLGLFSAAKYLPWATLLVAAFYLVTGTVALVLVRGEFALSPWAMVVPFGIGHLLLAAVFYFGWERNHGTI
jgi:hypothetical protein